MIEINNIENAVYYSDGTNKKHIYETIDDAGTEDMLMELFDGLYEITTIYDENNPLVICHMDYKNNDHLQKNKSFPQFHGKIIIFRTYSQTQIVIFGGDKCLLHNIPQVIIVKN